MGSVNKVILVGRVGQDPKIRDLANGGKVVGFSLATSERWRDKGSGETQEKTEWTNVSIFNDRIVDVVQRFVKKGSQVYVEGSLSTRKYTDKDGQERYATEVVIGRFKGELTLLDSARDAGGGEGGYQATPQQRALSQRPPQQKAMAYPEEGSGALLDDDIPFAPEWR